jgi:hypothetical protein
VKVPKENENTTKNELMGRKYNVQHIKTVSSVDASISVFDCDVQPGDFRSLDEYIRDVANGQGLEVMDMHVSEEGVADITELNLKMNAMNAGETKNDGNDNNSNSNDNVSDNVSDNDNNGWQKVEGADDDIGDSDDEWPPKTKKMKKKKKKKKRNRGRGQESRIKEDGEIGDSENPTADESSIVDLCGYSYTKYKAYFTLSIFDKEEVNPMTIEPTASKWYIFGKNEKPVLWNQQQKGWLVPIKFDSKLDMMGAIKV